MMRALAFSVAMLAASPAFATGDLVCDGDGVSIDLLVGHMDVLAISRAVVTIGEQTWSTQPEVTPGTPITIGQGFEDDRQLVVDITDEIVNEIVGRLRVFKATEGDSHAAGGVFSFKGYGAFVVGCSEER